MRNVQERRMRVLKLVIKEYIATAKPVPSQAIVDKYNLGVSPATIRNDMMALEQEGYLYHLHTSGGRVPTEKGYRFFVENLMEEANLPVTQRRMIQHQFYQSPMEVGQWAQLAAAVLARSTNCAGLATMPVIPCSKFKHLELIGVKETSVLLVLVLDGGMVRQRLLTLDSPMKQEELSAVAARLNALFRNLTTEEVGRRLRDLPPFTEQIGRIVHQIMKKSEGSISDQIYYEGLANILTAPEFQHSDKARQVVAILEEGEFVPFLVRPGEIGSVQVLIGGEGSLSGLRDVSMVLAYYGVPKQAVGLVGLVGPIRMAYAYNVSLVQYVAGLMSQLMQNLYNGEPR